MLATDLVSGTKYEDPNADGTLTDGTVPAGPTAWTVKAYTDAATPVFVKSTTTSTTDGTYSMDLEPGSYLICEVVRANWTQSAPGNTACSSVSGVGAGGHHVTVTSSGTFGGRDFGNYTTGTVSGTKYEDPNADGTLTDGTVPAGPTAWTIKAYTDAATPVFVKSTTTSTTDGTYSLTLDPGNYIVCEVPQTSWFQSTPANTNCSGISGVSPGGHQVTVTSSSTTTGKNFGNYRQGTVSGTKYEDPNADGTLTAGTAPAGPNAWPIEAWTDAATPVFVKSTTTSTTDGPYSLTLNPGNHTACDVPQTSWTQSAPSNTNCSGISGVSLGGHKVTVTSGSSATGRNFGNYTTGTVSGRKFDDVNANGNDDSGTESGLAGRTIRAYVDTSGDGTLQSGETTIAASTTTAGSAGAYSLSLNPGTYVLCEVSQNNWTQSAPSNTLCAALPAGQGVSPAGYAVTVTSHSATSARDFGNWPRGSISGYKWNDLNGNTNYDTGEQKLQGWTIKLCSDWACNTVLQTTTTDANGNYTFGGLLPGTYYVRETLKAGWVQTSPFIGYYSVVLSPTTPTTATDKNFGNQVPSGSTMTDSSFQLKDDLSPWTVNDFEILMSSKNTIVATNPGQFYYHQRATNN